MNEKTTKLKEATLYEILSRLHGVSIDVDVYVTNGIKVARIGTLNDVIRRKLKNNDYLNVPVDHFYFTRDIWISIADIHWIPIEGDCA
ncbi:MAG: hypothetical protein ACC608_09455 [Anaerofustis sp.]